MYSYYINPDKNCRCEIEEAMEYLVNLRQEYFSQIPVVFAVDDGYAMPTAVAITSLKHNKKTRTWYKCYLLTPGLSEDNYKKLKSLETFDCKIQIIQSDAISNYSARIKYIL